MEKLCRHAILKKAEVMSRLSEDQLFLDLNLSLPTQAGRLFSASCLLEAGDAMSDRILGQVGRAVNVQLLHDAVSMELHCFHRYAEDRGDFLRAAALGDELQDFPLAGGERRGRRLTSLPGRWFEDRVQHIFRNQRCEVLLALQDGLYRLAEFRRGGAFEEIPRGPGLKSLRRIGWTGMHSEKDQLTLRHKLV